MSNAAPNRIDPKTIMRIKNLELRAKAVVEGFMSGLHRSPYHGFSVEFTDYRQYSVGDDLRYLDWKLLARRDRSYIKRFEDETNLRCHLLLDLSRSMGFTSSEFTKADYARTLAATLAWFLNRQRDAVGVTTFCDHIVDMIPPRFRAGHLRRIMMTLEKATAGTSTDISAPLEQIAQTVSKRGLIVLVSDLLAPAEQLEKNLGYLSSRGHDVVILRVLDPAEIEFDFTQATMFKDLETGREIYVDPVSVNKDYKTQFEAHEASIRETCSNLGIDFFQVRTDEPLEDALFSVFQQRAHVGPTVKRASQIRGGAN
jgi:uncharacterized protein (DUF58 family)